MWHWWCWLFGTCVAATPAPNAVAPAPPAPTEAGAVPAALPGPAVTIRLALAGPVTPAARPALPELNIPLPTDADVGPPAWRRFAVAAPAADGRPALAIVIDDVGANAALSARTVALPGPLTLGWVPYAPQLAAQASAAAARGHEAVLDMPMEGLGRADPGPGALRSWLPPARNLAHLREALALLPNAVALTEQEGSVAVLSVPVMDLVMGELAARRIAYLDNPGLPHGVALTRAAAAGVPAAVRDVLIDADPSPTVIRARLAEAEMVAQRTGHSIVVAHARAATLDVLEQYLPTLTARGFVLWPISAVIARGAGVDPGSAEAAPRPPIRTTASSEDVIAPAQSSGAE
jgi:hypothetical protein